MNALKFQQDALTAHMRDPDRAQAACWCRKDNNHMALFINGHVCAFLPNAEMMLDPAKIKEVPGAVSFVEAAMHAWNTNNLLVPTEEYRMQAGNHKVRIYKARAWQTGIDQGLLKYFDNPALRLYQMVENKGILITEKTKGFEEPVGIVMPCRV